MAAAEPTLISVALPVHRAGAELDDAIAAILAQDHAALDLMIVLNGADEPTRVRAHAAAQRDRRVRVLTLERASLPAALNLALREARSDFVARMDADDTCPPERLRVQLAAALAQPSLAAIGSAWAMEETAGPRAGTVSAVRRPSTDPRETRWRLLLGNDFAHGSMLLRRDAVLKRGGYDESLDRAQDYDLWLRLGSAHAIAAVPEVLYRHRRTARDGYSTSPRQAELAATLMTRAWATLPTDDSPTEIAELLARAMSGDVNAARSALAARLTQRGPTRDALQAWTWFAAMFPTGPAHAAAVCLDARLREVLREASTPHELWLWGAGSHAGVLITALDRAGVRVAGVVDDFAAGQERHGMLVQSPDRLASGCVALLASDAHEETLWAASAGARARGVRVLRLYGDQART